MVGKFSVTHFRNQFTYLLPILLLVILFVNLSAGQREQRRCFSCRSRTNLGDCRYVFRFTHPGGILYIHHLFCRQFLPFILFDNKSVKLSPGSRPTRKSLDSLYNCTALQKEKLFSLVEMLFLFIVFPTFSSYNKTLNKTVQELSKGQ